MTNLALFIIICIFLGLLASIRDEISKTNKNLERILKHFKLDALPVVGGGTGTEPRPEGQVIPEGLRIFEAPDEQSKILAHASKTWSVQFGEEHNGWISVVYRSDSPLSVLNHGWVKTSELNQPS